MKELYMITKITFLDKYDLNHNNQGRLNQLIDNLILDYSKLLVIRLDLTIQKKFTPLINQHFMNEAFTRLRNNLRHNKLFEHYITYAAKLEYGVDKSWHYHVIFFFDGQKVNRDIWLSQQIGEYWVNVITRGIGLYYSSNMHQSDFLCNGVGMVHYGDTTKIGYLKEIVAGYLVKIDMGIADNGWRDQVGKCVRAFRMGEYVPKGRVCGRPRSVASLC